MSSPENTQEPQSDKNTDPVQPDVSGDAVDFDNQTHSIAEEGLTVELPTEEELKDVEVVDTTDGEDGDEAVTPDENEAVAPVPKEIPKQDYTSLTTEELITAFRKLVRNEEVQRVKDHVEEINTVLKEQFDAEEAEAKASFIEEGRNIIDFRHFSPLKKAFNEINYEYRNKRSRYFQSIRRDQQENLKERQLIIDELKGLRDELGGEDSFNATYNKFKNIQERWHNAGNIPRDRYNLVWNTYYHHVDNFYEFLHLNREFRDKHFKENLDKKLNLISRAEELAQEKDVNRAFKELQLLHRMWKDEIGPVAREYSDDIWKKFSQITKKVHDARQEFFKQKEVGFENNQILKQEIIDKITTINTADIKSHNGWQQKIKELETLRESFFKIGRVPNAVNETVWGAFKTAVKDFNHKKNNFYKSQKKEQYDNLNKKLELIRIAEENKDSEDREVATPLMKKIQDDWKKIGHVPRKDSDKVWKQFKEACNHYFNNISAARNKASAAEEEALVEKETMLKELGTVTFEGEPTKDLTTIKSFIERWKGIGRVPGGKRDIEQRFNKTLDGFFKQLDVSRKDAELIKYENRLAAIDEDSLIRERSFILRKIDEIKGEINQLENNLGFFQYVSDDNPMVKDVHKNINRHKDSLELWKAKLRKLKSL